LPRRGIDPGPRVSTNESEHLRPAQGP
jgi:hypothetical protein